MGRACSRCVRQPVGRCNRCSALLCARHQPTRGQRCDSCEVEYREDDTARRALQHMFAPPAFVLASGATFAALLPVLLALPFFAATVVVATLSVTAGFGAASATVKMIERAARAQFLREHARALPEARARITRRRLPAPRLLL